MYGMLIVAAFSLFIGSEVLFHQVRVPRAVSLRAAYPVLAFAIVGGIAQATKQSGYVWSSMYALVLITGFLGPLAFALWYGVKNRRNRAQG